MPPASAISLSTFEGSALESNARVEGGGEPADARVEADAPQTRRSAAEATAKAAVALTIRRVVTANLDERNNPFSVHPSNDPNGRKRRGPASPPALWSLR